MVVDVDKWSYLEVLVNSGLTVLSALQHAFEKLTLFVVTKVSTSKFQCNAITSCVNRIDFQMYKNRININ